MTVRTAASVPAGRTIAAWWRQLASHRPRRFWLADWLIHRLDVLTCCVRTVSLDPLPRLVLDALQVSDSPSARSVAIRLGIEPALAAALVRELAESGLAAAEVGSSWTITAAGRAALAQGEFRQTNVERRTFTLRHDPPMLLPLMGHGKAVALIDPPAAPLEALRACVGRPAEWKRRVGFPEEVTRIFDLTAPPPEGVPAWKRVPVDRPERLTIALIQSDDQILGFPIKSDGLTLIPEPALALPTDELTRPDSGPDAWRTAWLDWCGGAIPATLEPRGHQLVVTVSADVALRLRTAHPELLRGEAWLASNDAFTRELAEIVLSLK